MSFKICVSTAAFGGFEPAEISLQSSENEVVLNSFTDHNYPSRTLSMHPRLKGKIIKMLSHRFNDADWYVWMDSTLISKSPDFIDRLSKNFLGSDLVLYRHSSRKSILEELNYMLQHMKESSEYLKSRYSGEPIAEQVAHYLDDKCFQDTNLFEMGFFAYNRNAIAMMEEWFMQNCVWSIQDQLSFPYVLSKHCLKIKVLPGSVRDNEYVWRGNLKSNDRAQATILERLLKLFSGH